MELNRKALQEVYERMDYNTRYLLNVDDNHSTLVYKNRTVAIIDNGEGKCGDVIERILKFADALVCEAAQEDIYGASDVLEFEYDDQRYVLDPCALYRDGEDADYEKWEARREAIRGAKALRVAYEFLLCDTDPEFMAGEGLHRLLRDLLDGGRRADCVTLYTLIEHCDCKDAGNGLEYRYNHLLTMNGMHDGAYVDGEVPFVQDEERIRRCGGWRQSEVESSALGYGLEDEGIYFQVRAPLGAELEARLHSCLDAFRAQVKCKMEDDLAYSDYQPHLTRTAKDLETDEYRNMSEEEQLALLMEAARSDYGLKERLLLEVPDFRNLFTEAEKAEMEAFAGIKGDAFVRDADRSHCSADDVARVRFASMLAEANHLINDTFKHCCFLEGYAERMHVSEEMYEKLCKLLETDEVRAALKRFPVDRGFGSGLGDITEEEFERETYETNQWVRIHCCHLSGMEDVRAMCALLNELDEIAALASAGYDGPDKDGRGDIPFGECNFRELAAYMKNMMPAQLDIDREEFADEKVVMFEAERAERMARLRFRKQDGRYIYEIAQAELESGACRNLHIEDNVLIEYIGSEADVKIPECVEIIGECAFCKSDIRSVYIPRSVRRIKYSAFEFCESLEEVVFDEDCDIRIDPAAFARCHNLERVSFPRRMDRIRADLFIEDACLKSFRVPEGVKRIGSGAFIWCKALEGIVLPEGVEEIGNDAFLGCDALRRVVIPESVRLIGSGAFRGCNALELSALPGDLEVVGELAFCDCKFPAEIRFPEKTRSVSNRCFSGGRGLKKISYPASCIISIDDDDNGRISAENPFVGCQGAVVEKY